jgi:phospholipid transport system substrate-binding protein
MCRRIRGVPRRSRPSEARRIAVKKMASGFLVLVLLIFPVVSFAGVALDTVKANANAVLDVLKDPALKGEKGAKVKKEKVHNAAMKFFDFVELSKRTLGLNWNKLTPDQRKEFVDLYRSLLEDAYVDKLISYTNEKITFTKEVPLSETTVEVQSMVTSKTGDIPIFYRVIKKENEWKVYDVVIEGVSLVTNYRNQFREILGNNPPEKLLETLRTKVGKR